MDQQETLDLWEQGPEAWNAWAQEMLSRPTRGRRAWEEEAAAHFEGHTSSENADLEGIIIPGQAHFNNLIFEGSFSLSSSTLHGDVYFDGCHFKEEATFVATQFLGQVYYNSAKFDSYPVFADAQFASLANFYKVEIKGDAVFTRVRFGSARFNDMRFFQRSLFNNAQFDGFAQFNGVEFHGEADFVGARFLRGVSFSERTEFRAAAVYSRAEFLGAGSFGEARLLGRADFQAIKSEGSFDMAGATFEEVPNFIQATFAEAPRLDNVTIRRKLLDTTNGASKSGGGADDLPALWRALKRLALQGHDHIREQEYFAQELLALRRQKGRGISAGAIWLYDQLSDFGRSMVRPMVSWGLTVFVFAFFYLLIYFSVHDAALPACARSPATALWMALLLSFHKGLPFTGIGSPEKLNQIYACLYGIHGGGTGELPERFTPVIPDLVYLLGILQTLFSLVLIFLLLLALRNHFRIR